MILAGISAAATTTAKTSTTKPAKTSTSSHTTSKSTKSGKTTSSKSKKKKSTSAASHGQHGIDTTRTREIQEALIREHYMTGEATGAWDQTTKEALAKYQEANGWQTKSLPDSRALIKLGLGPDKKGLLNPDTASMSSPHELGTQHDTLPGGSSQQ
jgi:hypothetical protein